jgi:hypothetical protein
MSADENWDTVAQRDALEVGSVLGAPITCDVKTLPVRIQRNMVQVNAG